MNDDVSQLTQLGSNKTEYKYSGPCKEILETFPNKFPERVYEITHESKEFTSLCPRTGQPDFAEITVTYMPNLLCVESKSLKLYIGAYRNEGSFMETICNRILSDLVAVCAPRTMYVDMVFNARGGITTKVGASHYESTSE